jgi:hypothetical protein
VLKWSQCRGSGKKTHMDAKRLGSKLFEATLFAYSLWYMYIKMVSNFQVATKIKRIVHMRNSKHNGYGSQREYQ